MAVYVDDPIHRYRSMLMCHMVADSSEELHRMARAIGVDARWIQSPGTPREHFDVCKSKRQSAVRHGAIEVSPREIVRVLRRKRTTEEKGG